MDGMGKLPFDSLRYGYRLIWKFRGKSMGFLQGGPKNHQLLYMDVSKNGGFPQQTHG